MSNVGAHKGSRCALTYDIKKTSGNRATACVALFLSIISVVIVNVGKVRVVHVGVAAVVRLSAAVRLLCAHIRCALLPAAGTGCDNLHLESDYLVLCSHCSHICACLLPSLSGNRVCAFSPWENND